MRQGLYRFSFDRIGTEDEIGVIERSLLPIGEAISGSADTIEQAKRLGDEQYAECVVDDETEMIENLLGVVFVICQSYITFVVSRVKRLHELCERFGARLTTTDDEKANIMRLGSSVLAGTEYTQVQIIDAFANYFKHREEWHGDWADLGRPASRTVSVIQAVGAQQFSTGNFRTASARLGNEGYSDVRVFCSILRGWGREVHRWYDAELRERGVV